MLVVLIVFQQFRQGNFRDLEVKDGSNNVVCLIQGDEATMKINTINENTTDSGVTIENVLLKDGTITTTNDATINTNLNVFGNLNVTGNINAINADQIHVEDKLVILGSVASPTDVTAANGGLLLKGDTDKEFKWTSSTGWNSSEKITGFTRICRSINR